MSLRSLQIVQISNQSIICWMCQKSKSDPWRPHPTTSKTSKTKDLLLIAWCQAPQHTFSGLVKSMTVQVRKKGNYLILVRLSKYHTIHSEFQWSPWLDGSRKGGGSLNIRMVNQISQYTLRGPVDFKKRQHTHYQVVTRFQSIPLLSTRVHASIGQACCGGKRSTQ